MRRSYTFVLATAMTMAFSAGTLFQSSAASRPETLDPEALISRIAPTQRTQAAPEVSVHSHAEGAGPTRRTRPSPPQELARAPRSR